MANKAQTATEYLIILAVVIIIALIVVGVMGGIPGMRAPQTLCTATKGSATFFNGTFARCDCPTNTTFNTTLGCIKV